MGHDVCIVQVRTGNLVLGVLLAVTALAVGTAGLGYVDLRAKCQRLQRHQAELKARDDAG